MGSKRARLKGRARRRKERTPDLAPAKAFLKDAAKAMEIAARRYACAGRVPHPSYTYLYPWPLPVTLELRHKPRRDPRRKVYRGRAQKLQEQVEIVQRSRSTGTLSSCRKGLQAVIDCADLLPDPALYRRMAVRLLKGLPYRVSLGPY